MTKQDYAVFEVNIANNEWDNQDEVRFALLKLDSIFLQRLLEKARVVAAANIVASAQGHSMYSAGFYNADPLLVGYPVMEEPRERICSKIEDELFAAEPNEEVVIRLDDGEVDKLDTVWGQYHELHIDADGEWLEWEIHTKAYILEFRWHPGENYAWVMEPLRQARQKVLQRFQVLVETEKGK